MLTLGMLGRYVMTSYSTGSLVHMKELKTPEDTK